MVWPCADSGRRATLAAFMRWGGCLVVRTAMCWLLCSLVGLWLMLCTAPRHLFPGLLVAGAAGYYLFDRRARSLSARKGGRQRLSRDKWPRALLGSLGVRAILFSLRCGMLLSVSYVLLLLYLSVSHAIGCVGLRSTRFPFRPDSFAVDAVGRVYVGMGLWHRIEVFDRNGVFKTGFFVPSINCVIKVRVDGQGKVLVRSWTDRGHEILTYDSSGRLLRRAFERRPTVVRDTQTVLGLDGRLYRIENRTINPTIARYEIDGRKSLAIRGPLLLVPLATDFNWLAVVTSSIALGCIQNKLTSRERDAQTESA